MWERERDVEIEDVFVREIKVCVYVCMSDKKVCVSEWEREKECVWVCEYMCVREYVCKCVSVCLSDCVCVCVFKRVSMWEGKLHDA